MLTSNGYVLDESARRLGELRAVPDAVRGDRDALWELLRAEGYLFLPGALDRDAVLAFRRYYFEALGGCGLTVPGSDGVAAGGPVDAAGVRRALFRDVVPGAPYERFCTQPAIRDWYAWFLGGEIFPHRRRILRHTTPGRDEPGAASGIGRATPAHYDLVYLREGTDRVLSSWIPLGDCPRDLGGLIYLERSHHRVLADEAANALPHPAAAITADLPALAERRDSRWLVADYAAGDLLVHSAHLVHASLDNVDEGGRLRLSTDIRYQRADHPIDWRWQQHWHPDDGL